MIWLTKNKHIVHVGTKYGRNTQRVLHRNQEEHLLVSAVQEQVADILIMNPTVIVQAVIQNHKGAWIQAAALDHLTRLARLIFLLLDFAGNQFLAFDEIHQNRRVVFTMDKDGWNDFSVETV